MKLYTAFWLAAASGCAAWGQVHITLVTIPNGLAISVDGAAAEPSPRLLSWPAGSVHTIAVASPQGESGTRYTFAGWSDGGAVSHSITVPSSPASFTALFNAQHQLTRIASPFIAGVVVALPPTSDGYYNAGSVVQLTASPNAGFSFAGYQGDVSGAAPSQTVVMSAPRTVTASFSLMAGVTNAAVAPRLVFRDNWGALRAHVYGSSTLLSAGGLLGGDPQVAVSAEGDAYIVCLDTYKSMWVNVLRGSDLVFTGWRAAGGIISGVPAIGLAPNGSVYVVVRDTYNSYWFTSYNLVSGLSPWINLGGNFTTDPAMAISAGGRVNIVGTDRWNALWSTSYLPGAAFPGWRLGGGIIRGKPSLAIGSDDVMYVAVRDTYDGLWVGRVQGQTWLGWSFGGGIMSLDPKIVTLGDGTVVAVVRDAWAGVWYRPYTEGTGGGWLPWVNAGGKLNSPAVAASGGELYIGGASTAGDLLWYRAKSAQWTSAGFRGAINGEISAGPR